MLKSKFGVIRTLVLILLAAAIGFTAFALTACGPSDGEDPDVPGEKTVSSIKVSKEPTKTEYFVGETFSVEGGEITVTYSDGSTDTKKMTDEGVTVADVSIAINDEDNDSETKNVRVTFGGKYATFEITVSYEMFTVTYDLGYADAEDIVQQVRSGDTLRAPADPERDGFTFAGWFADAEFTEAFDFGTAVTADTTVYAQWEDASVEYFDVTFDNNYTWAPNGSTQRVESGLAAVKPATDPERFGYTFAGWYSDAEGNNAYNFSTAITEDTTIYAKWTINAEYATGTHEYVFEAENTNLDGKAYPGLSGSASAGGLIQTYTTNARGEALNANGNKFVGYQTTEGASVDFIIVSDRTVTDATIVLRLSKELSDYTLSTSNYNIKLNNVALEFQPIAFTNVPQQTGGDVSALYALPFQDYVIAENVTLKEGRNNINCIVANSDPIPNTTITANGPLVDCLKITTSAVLDWSVRNGLPKEY